MYIHLVSICIDSKVYNVDLGVGKDLLYSESLYLLTEIKNKGVSLE